MIAFLTQVAETRGRAARWLHFGMTSSDTLDTALALQIRDAGALLRGGRRRASREVLLRRALEFRHTPCIGRTHGVHAEPTTFGLKLLVFQQEMRAPAGAARGARCARPRSARSRAPSAPSRTCAPEVEEAVCARLGIGFEPVGDAGGAARPPRGAASRRSR